MKKNLALFLAIILVFCLSACSYNTDNTSVRNTGTLSGSTNSYIGNRNSKKIHIPSCQTLPKEKNCVYFATSDEAIQNGYDPCKNCQP